MDSQSRVEHWNGVYGSKAPTEVSWFAEHLEPSLSWITEITATDARVLDVGAGASTLVDDLLARGYAHLSVLDVSAPALAAVQQRLGERAQQVQWLPGDVTNVTLPAAGFDLWHDRAVLHFLTDPAEQQAYAAQLKGALAPGGYVILAPFALSGPDKCSGLAVQRYGSNELRTLLGTQFQLVREAVVTHHTPAGEAQDFQFTMFHRR